jgi:hypothetical protein
MKAEFGKYKYLLKMGSFESIFSSTSSHVRVLPANLYREDPFIFYQSTGETQACRDIFMSQSGIVLQYLSLQPSSGQQVKNELNRQAGALITGSPARRLVPQIRLAFLDIFSHCF